MSKVLVPDYFDIFHCKCGECRRPCCDGWGINVDEHEYFTLIGLACSKRLRHKLDDAFVLQNPATEATYASIRPNYLEQCPMLDEDGLCLLQKEKGEKVMPLICRVYPRAVKKYGDRHEICMSCSCEMTVESLMQSTSPLTLHEAEVDLPFDGLRIYGDEPEKERVRHGVIAAMSDSSVPIGDRLGIIGNFVSGQIFSPEGTRKEALSTLTRFLSVLCKRSRSIREQGEQALAYLGEGSDSLDKFDAAEAHLYALVPDLEAYAGRIIANHLLYESFPYVPDCDSADTAFAAFCMAVGILKLLCVCGMAESDNISDLVDIIASANRFTEHSDYYRACSRLAHPAGMDVYAMISPIFYRAKTLTT